LAAIRISNLRKTYPGGRRAVDGISLAIEPGEMVALIGASGSGKSTLLRQINGLVLADTHSESMVEVFGETVQRAGRLDPAVRQRRADIGFIFQQFNLVERLPVATNVLVGLLPKVPLWRGLLGRFNLAEREQAIKALDRVGIAEQAWQRASTLSGGQQQRAAIARALVQGARIVLADEPIASLDPEASRRVMALLAEINRDLGVTVVVCLHQVEYALRFCPRVIALREGRTLFDGPSKNLDPALLAEVYGSEFGVHSELEIRREVGVGNQTDSMFVHPPGVVS
jgi:phosphonate transport system ATP-binding protein